MSTKKHTILIVDDELGVRQALKMILSAKYNVLTASDAKTALEAVNKDKNIEVAALDMKLVESDGLSLLKSIKKANPDIEVLMITGFPSTDTAVEAMQHGAYDYVMKPFNKAKIEEAIQKGIVRRTQDKLQKSLFSTLMKELTN